MFFTDEAFDSSPTFSVIYNHIKDLLQFCANMLPKISDEIGTRLLMVVLRYQGARIADEINWR
jgi:hypothetical protein